MVIDIEKIIFFFFPMFSVWTESIIREWISESICAFLTQIFYKAYITDIESLCDKILILSNGTITQFNSDFL